MIDVIKNFSRVPAAGRRLLVLGDMLELGEQAADMHAQVAQAINPDQIAAVYLYGDLMKSLQVALKQSLPVYYYQLGQMDLLIAALKKDLKADDMVLLKASNGLHLDQVLAALLP